MSLKIFNEITGKWEKASSLLASSIKVLDTNTNYENENVESCLEEIANKMDVIKNDVKYIYENGTIGGGSGGGSSMPTIVIDGVLNEQGIHEIVVKSDEVIDIYYFFNSPNAGNGMVELSYGSTIVREAIRQGRNKWTVGPFERGNHSLSIVVEDRQGFVSDPARIQVISGAIEITSPFSDNGDFSLIDDIEIPYRILTELPETLTVELKFNDTVTTKVINKGDNIWNIGELPNLGVHSASITVYTETAISNTLYYTLIAADSENLFVSSKFNEKTFQQGKNLQIDYRISMRDQYQFKSNLYLNNELVETVRNVLGVSYWNLGNSLPIGIHTIKIESMTLDEVHKDELELEVEIVEAGLMDIDEPTNGLIAKFDSNGKSSNSINKDIWEDRSGSGVSCLLKNYNHTTNGWFIDDELDQVVLKCSGKTYAEIDLAPFENGLSTGLTFDIYFKITNTGNMDAKVVDCKNVLTPFQGFMIDTEKALLEGRQSVKTQFQDDSWTRVTFTIDRMENTIRTYTNAIISNVSFISPRDAQDDEFTFDGKILLGAGRDENGDIVDNSTCSIRTIRVYNRALTNEEILNVHMYDIKNADQLNEIYQLNYGEISIPIMTITGVGIESLEPDQASIGARIDYVDPSNPSKRFTKDLCNIAIQGTTSKYYPVKNYTIWLNENDGRPTTNYTPNDDWMPEARWTLKTNYMDSSHANNVGLNKFAHELFKENPYPQQQVNPSTRSCTDGQPIKVIINGKDCGVYTWNIDRYAHNNYGFITYNEDGTINRNNNIVSYEVAVNSTNGAGAFNDDTWDSIKYEFSSRYNYRGTNVSIQDGNDTILAPGMHTELVELVSWTKNATDDEFRADVTKYFSLPHLIDYYLCVYAFGMIDNLGKNMIITSYGRNEDGHLIWYPSFYDCDSVLGLANNGELRYDAGVDMNNNAFNTRTSALWTKLNRNFYQEIKDRYVRLRRERNINGVIEPPMFSEEYAMRFIHDDVMARIGQRYYNEDAERKYVNDEGSTWLIACNGTREDFTRRWLKERFIYLDSVFEQGEFNLKTMVLRTNVLGPVVVKLKTYSPMWVRINYTSSHSKKIYVSKDRFYDFEINMTNDLENDFTIYGADNLMFVNNMETLNVSHMSIGGAEKLIEVNCAGSQHIKGLELGQNKYLQRVICNDCSQLGIEESDRHLNLSGCQNLREVNCSNTKIATLSLPTTGGVIEELNCTNSWLTSFNMVGQEYLDVLELNSCSRLSSLTVENCNGLKTINMPNTILSSCIVRGCDNVEDINISNTKFLTTIDLRGCPGLKKLDLSNVLSTTLTTLDLSASLNLETLDISSTAYIETIVFGRYVDVNGNLTNFNSLKSLDCRNSGIKAVKYGLTSITPDYMDLNGLSLTYLTFESCPNIKDIRNINITVHNSAPFRNCVNLVSLQGSVTLTGYITQAFFNCYNLRNIHNTLNLNLTSATSSSEAFYLCRSFGWNEVSFILSKTGTSFTGGWRTFSGCTGISGSIPANLFATCPNITSTHEFFAHCTGITGELPAGLFSNCTRLSDMSETFYNTKISGAIPHDFLRGPGTSLRNLYYAFYGTNINTMPTSNMLQWNTNLTDCGGMFHSAKIIGEIPSDLFGNKPELSAAFSVFYNNTGIFGSIPRDLFRQTPKLTSVATMIKLTGMSGEIPRYINESTKGLFDDCPMLTSVNDLLPANISGEIPPDLFKHNPRLTVVSGLFEATNITGEIPAGMFDNNPSLALADRLFKNCDGLDTVIPKGLFDNCADITSVSEIFYGCTGLKGQIPFRVSTWHQKPSADNPEIMEDYEIVSEYGLFDKCANLTNVASAFAHCTNMATTIPETLLINGRNIQSTANMFQLCNEVYGGVPEKLFENCTNLISANYMFADCCKLGRTELELTENDPYVLPEYLFKNCRELRTIFGMFSMWSNNRYSTHLRGHIHRNMFRYNLKLEDIGNLFAGCSLISGPLEGDIFNNNPELRSARNAFRGPKFSSIGSEMLRTNSKISNIEYMFMDNNTVTGTAPALWQTGASITTGCFRNCTFTNQDDIPATYK